MPARNGHLELSSTLLTKPEVDPTASEHGAIRDAFRNGYLQIVRLLAEDPRITPHPAMAPILQKSVIDIKIHLKARNSTLLHFFVHSRNESQWRDPGKIISEIGVQHIVEETRREYSSLSESSQ